MTEIKPQKKNVSTFWNSTHMSGEKTDTVPALVEIIVWLRAG